MIDRPRYRSQQVRPGRADGRGREGQGRSVNGTGIIASPTDIQAPVIHQIQLTGHRRRIGRDILALRPVHPQLIVPIPDGTGKTAAGCHCPHPLPFLRLNRASPLDREVPVGSRYKIKPPPAFIAEGQLVADLRIGNHKALVGDIGDLLPILLKGQFLVG